MKKKFLITLSVVACAILLVVGSIAGTVAYLTSVKAVTNTFTVGAISITLNESKVDVYGTVVTPEERVITNTYKLVPGRTYTKNPVVTVTQDSEECWLFVKVENGLADIEVSGNTTIDAQIKANGWTALDGQAGVYYKANVTSTSTDTLTHNVFASFTLASNANVASYKDAEIKVTAYAVQSAELNDVNDAWNAVKNMSAN